MANKRPDVGMVIDEINAITNESLTTALEYYKATTLKALY